MDARQGSRAKLATSHRPTCAAWRACKVHDRSRCVRLRCPRTPDRGGGRRRTATN